MSIIQTKLRSLPIQGKPGFTRALVESISISSYITVIRQSKVVDAARQQLPGGGDKDEELNTIVVEFAIEDVLLAGIPDEHIKQFLALKASVLDDDPFLNTEFKGKTYTHS